MTARERPGMDAVGAVGAAQHCDVWGRRFGCNVV
jgi:hypothetical protein